MSSRTVSSSPDPSRPQGPSIRIHSAPGHITPRGGLCALSSPSSSPRFKGAGPRGYLLLLAPSPSCIVDDGSISPLLRAHARRRPPVTRLFIRACTAPACYTRPVIPALRFSFRSPAHYSPPKTGVAPGLTGIRVVFARAIYCGPGRPLAASSLLSPTSRRSAPRSRQPTSHREERDESLQRGISGSVACGCSPAGSSASTSIYTPT